MYDQEKLEYFMKEALIEANKANQLDEVPVGCVIVKDGKIVARGYNQRENNQIATAHAEIIAIENACQNFNSWRLDDCDLFVTLEPCLMCIGAISLARCRSVVFGAKSSKGSIIAQLEALNHHPVIYGNILEEDCSLLIKNFFQKKRLQQKEQKNEL